MLIPGDRSRIPGAEKAEPSKHPFPFSNHILQCLGDGCLIMALDASSLIPYILVITKGYRVRMTMIEGQNTFCSSAELCISFT